MRTEGALPCNFDLIVTGSTLLVVLVLCSSRPSSLVPLTPSPPLPENTKLRLPLQDIGKGNCKNPFEQAEQEPLSALLGWGVARTGTKNSRNRNMVTRLLRAAQLSTASSERKRTTTLTASGGRSALKRSATPYALTGLPISRRLGTVFLGVCALNLYCTGASEAEGCMDLKTSSTGLQ